MWQWSPGERLSVSPGAPLAAPASSWNSLIHQHSSEISCRKDIFIDCDKKKKGGGRAGGAARTPRVYDRSLHRRA